MDGAEEVELSSSHGAQQGRETSFHRALSWIVLLGAKSCCKAQSAESRYNGDLKICFGIRARGPGRDTLKPQRWFHVTNRKNISLR